jgi:hypothetical protein
VNGLRINALHDRLGTRMTACSPQFGHRIPALLTRAVINVLTFLAFDLRYWQRLDSPGIVIVPLKVARDLKPAHFLLWRRVPQPL